jgi:regulator of RNase E activity RraA
MSFFNRYAVTVSICPPNDTDCREQMTYNCNLDSLLKNPDILKAYVLEVSQKLEERLAREGAVLDGPVRDSPQIGGMEWPKGTQDVEV